MTENKKVNNPAANTAHPARKRIFVNDAQIEAAKLQISIDRKFGHETLDIIKKIAAAK